MLIVLYSLQRLIKNKKVCLAVSEIFTTNEDGSKIDTGYYIRLHKVLCGKNRYYPECNFNNIVFPRVSSKYGARCTCFGCPWNFIQEYLIDDEWGWGLYCAYKNYTIFR